MKKYEVMYIINASLEDEVRQTVMENVHSIITNNGGTVSKVDDWGIRNYAYEINHTTKGHYVVINAEANNEAIKEFDRLMRINNNIVRYMIIKLDEE